ncbi:hypothetical protein THAOC_05560, partial [Thalassiosira oceanica]
YVNVEEPPRAQASRTGTPPFRPLSGAHESRYQHRDGAGKDGRDIYAGRWRSMHVRSVEATKHRRHEAVGAVAQSAVYRVTRRTDGGTIPMADPPKSHAAGVVLDEGRRVRVVGEEPRGTHDEKRVWGGAMSEDNHTPARPFSFATITTTRSRKPKLPHPARDVAEKWARDRSHEVTFYYARDEMGCEVVARAVRFGRFGVTMSTTLTMARLEGQVQ